MYIARKECFKILLFLLYFWLNKFSLGEQLVQTFDWKSTFDIFTLNAMYKTFLCDE